MGSQLSSFVWESLICTYGWVSFIVSSMLVFYVSSWVSSSFFSSVDGSSGNFWVHFSFSKVCFSVASMSYSFFLLPFISSSLVSLPFVLSPLLESLPSSVSSVYWASWKLVVSSGFLGRGTSSLGTPDEFWSCSLFFPMVSFSCVWVSLFVKP